MCEGLSSQIYMGRLWKIDWEMVHLMIFNCKELEILIGNKVFPLKLPFFGGKKLQCIIDYLQKELVLGFVELKRVCKLATTPGD